MSENPGAYYNCTGPPYKAANIKPVPRIAGRFYCEYSYNLAIIRAQQRKNGVKTAPLEIFNNSLKEEEKFLADVNSL